MNKNNLFILPCWPIFLWYQGHCHPRVSILLQSRCEPHWPGNFDDIATGSLGVWTLINQSELTSVMASCSVYWAAYRLPANGGSDTISQITCRVRSWRGEFTPKVSGGLFMIAKPPYSNRASAVDAFIFSILPSPDLQNLPDLFISPLLYVCIKG